MSGEIKLYCFVQTVVVSVPRASNPSGGPPPLTTASYPPLSSLPATLPPTKPTSSNIVSELTDSVSGISLSSNRYLRRPDDENKSFNESGTQTTHDSSEEDRNTSPADQDDDDEPITDGRRIVGQVCLCLAFLISDLV